MVSLGAWLYYRSVTDDNATSVTDHVVKVDLTSANFSFAKAQSDGADLRFYDVSADLILPHWIKSYDDGAETAEIWVRITDMTHEHRLYYGNAVAEHVSYGHNTFDLFESFGNDPVGDQPAQWVDDNSASEDASNYSKIDGTIAKPDVGCHYTISQIATLNTVSGTNKTTASRIPNQRSGWYSAGRYWRFYGDQQTGDDPGPYDFYYTSSTDGSSWAAGTLETAGGLPKYDAQFTIYYDSSNDRVHIVRVIQSNGIVHDGLEYRRGQPQSGGSITWDASWQTVVSTGTKCGDASLIVLSDGKAVVGIETGSSFVVYKNSATDGTWSTASGYPVTVETTDATNPPEGILLPLLSGEYLVMLGYWDLDEQGQAYHFDSSDSSPTKTAEGAFTSLDIEADSGSGARVPRFNAISVDGVVHYIYQASSQSIVYGYRNAAGVWQDEIELVTDRYVYDACGAPLLCVDGNGDLHCFFPSAIIANAGGATGMAAIGAFRIVDNIPSGPVMIRVSPAMENTYGHIVVDQECNGQNASMTILDTSDNVKNLLVTCPTAYSETTRAFRTAKASTSNFRIMSRMGAGFGAGYLYECDIYVVNVSQGGDNNDNLDPLRLCNAARTNIACLPLIYGDPVGTGGDDSLGYLFGGHNKGIAAVNRNTWYRLGIKVKASSLWDLLWNEATVATDIGVAAGSADYTYLMTGIMDVHTCDFVIDNIRCRAWVATEPDIAIGAEIGTTVPVFFYSPTISQPLGC